MDNNFWSIHSCVSLRHWPLTLSHCHSCGFSMVFLNISCCFAMLFSFFCCFFFVVLPCCFLVSYDQPTWDILGPGRFRNGTRRASESRRPDAARQAPQNDGSWFGVEVGKTIVFWAILSLMDVDGSFETCRIRFLVTLNILYIVFWVTLLLYMAIESEWLEVRKVSSAKAIPKEAILKRSELGK